MDREMRQLMKLFKALSDETRHKIFELLCSEEMNVGDICEEFHVTQPSISHHLHILKSCDLIDSRKQGRMIYYYVNREVVNDIFGNVIEKFHIEVSE